MNLCLLALLLGNRVHRILALDGYGSLSIRIPSQVSLHALLSQIQSLRIKMEHEICSAIAVYILVFIICALLGLSSWATLKKEKAPLPFW